MDKRAFKPAHYLHEEGIPSKLGKQWQPLQAWVSEGHTASYWHLGGVVITVYNATSELQECLSVEIDDPRTAQ
jgi:hypothetical protein